MALEFKTKNTWNSLFSYFFKYLLILRSLHYHIHLSAYFISLSWKLRKALILCGVLYFKPRDLNLGCTFESTAFALKKKKMGLRHPWEWGFVTGIHWNLPSDFNEQPGKMVDRSLGRRITALFKCLCKHLISAWGYHSLDIVNSPNSDSVICKKESDIYLQTLSAGINYARPMVEQTVVSHFKI